MSHTHFCDVVSHEYVCADLKCKCIGGVSMEEGDHNDCPVELRVCPAHVHLDSLPDDEKPGGLPLCLTSDFEAKAERAVRQLENYEAVCLWCGLGYDEFSPKDEDEHFAHNCPDAPQELRDNAKRRLMRNGYDEACCESEEEQDGRSESR